MLIDYKRELDLILDYLLSVISYRTNIPLVKPTRINFDITNRCPLRCVMCNICRRDHRENDELELSELESIIDQAVEWGIDNISFAGGETLVRKNDVLELIDYCSSKNMTTSLITSGTIFDKKTFDKIFESGLDKLTISLDGATEKTHDYIRGKGAFEKAMRTAKYFSNNRNGKKNLELEFATCVMSYNYMELLDIYELMKEVGFDFVNYQAVVPDNNYSNFNKSVYDVDFWLDSGESNNLRSIVNKLIKLKEEEGKIRNSKYYLKKMPDYFILKNEFNPGRCMAGYRVINIDPYGNINICGLGPNLNVRDAPLRELWTHDEFKKTRIKIKDCKVPCMMLCYEKLVFMDLYNSWIDKRIGEELHDE